MAFRRRVTGGRGRAAPDNAPASAEKWSLYAAEYDGMVCPPGGDAAAGWFGNPGRDAFRLLGDRDRPVADGACFSACAEKGIRGGDSASADRAVCPYFQRPSRQGDGYVPFSVHRTNPDYDRFDGGADFLPAAGAGLPGDSGSANPQRPVLVLRGVCGDPHSGAGDQYPDRDCPRLKEYRPKQPVYNKKDAAPC